MRRFTPANKMLKKIITHFEIRGKLGGVEPFGAGLINETWRCSFLQGKSFRHYLLQRVNRRIFPRPDRVMENVVTVTTHLAGRILQEGVADPADVSPVLVPARNGRFYWVDERGDYWRMFPFIEDTVAFDTVRDERHAYEVGRGLGRFQSMLSDLPPVRLHDTLPGFHHTPRYLDELGDAVGRDSAERKASVREELAFVDSRRGMASLLLDAVAGGKVPLRVVHNDPKVNNILINRKTGRALCMVDLDTVKPGIVPFDYGDCVRSAANPAGEEAADLAQVRLDRGYADAIDRGYREEAASFLTDEEKWLLPASVLVITFELGIRFLADHLRGDTYFRIAKAGQNLHRARVQFRLLESMERSVL
jgi:Ser/Thr protein kinase RdoA (MazF antagonist)